MAASKGAVSEIDDKKASSKGAIIGVVVASLIAILAGGGIGSQFATMISSSKPEIKQHKPAKNTADKSMATTYVGNRVVKALLPIVTNLAEPKNAWIRLEGAIIFNGADEVNFDEINAQISQDTLAYLRTLRMIDLEGASALTYLRDDLTERARTRSKGKILELVISSLVVE